MRYATIKPRDTTSATIDRDTAERLGELAARLDAADKPQGFPQTVGRSNRPARPYAISKAAALAGAVAVVLDMLDSGSVDESAIVARMRRGEQ